MVNFRFRCLGLIVLLVACSGLCLAQTNSTGAVAGSVTDPSGAVVPNAVVHLDQAATNIHLNVKSGSSGTFSFSGLQPGSYKLSVEAKGFPLVSQAVIVQVGQVSNAPVSLKLGQGATTVEVTGAAAANVQVDTTTATVSGVVTTQQIQNLPQIGRNFLDLAQLEPGVQLIDGGNFDPTKNGFAGLSVQGAEGRTTEINVNGIDITDQTVGTTVTNLSDDSIQEFQVSQSSGDTSSDIGNTGQVNIITRSGSNSIHGNGFANYRSKRFAANPVLGGAAPPFKQNQDGLSFGGPFLKNHLYWFVNGERTWRDASSAVDMPDFPNYTGVFSTPGFEKDGDARLDWQATPSLHVFYYFNTFSNELIPPGVIGGTSLSPFQNEDVTNTHVATAEWSTARFTNSFHYGHVGFFNHIISTPVAGVPSFPVGISFSDTGETFGPNLLAPQHTFQISDEYKYDGSVFFGNHTLRYGFEYNHFANVVYAAFFAVAPVLSPTYANGPISGSPLDPMNYAPDGGMNFGNGLGYFSNLAVHGNPFGGVFNPRRAFYVTDTWKVRPNLTLDYGVHFERDPGEVNSDLAHPNIIGGAFPNLAESAKVGSNFSPNIGLSWDPTGHGTTAFRLGAGMYYENNIWNNVLFERANYISAAIAPGFPFATNGTPLMDATGKICLFLCPGSGQNNQTQSTAQLAPAIVAAQQALQASYAALPLGNVTDPNKAAILGGGGSTAPGTNITGNPLFDNTYRTPYSVQMNFGVEHQFAPGIVLSANFVTNQGHDLLMIQDQNHVGAARTLNAPVAAEAINGTATDLGVSPGSSTSGTLDNILAAIGSNAPACGKPSPSCTTPASIQGQTITASMIRGELVNGNGLNGASIGAGANGKIGSPTFAFGGLNPNFGNLSADRNLGRSNYHALQVKLLLQRGAMLRWLHSSNMTISYAYGRLNSTQFDQAFAPGTTDADNPTRFYGPNGYDRTSQLSVGGIFNLPAGFVLSTVNHFATGFPVTPRLGNSGLSAGEIFRTDWTGDGTVGDVIPGTNVGAYNRSIASGAQLQHLINSYNGIYAGQLTPAGQALVASGVVTASQMQQLGLVMPFIKANVAPGQLKPDSFMDTDLRLAKNFKIGEHFTITPQVECFNLFNIGNYDPPGDVMSGTVATGSAPGLGFGNAGSITNTTAANDVRKFGLNTGVFAAGIPRAFQGGIRFSF